MALCLLFGALGTAQDLSPGDTVRVGVLKDGSYTIVTLPLETYVARVLAGEALPGSDPAAYEALAIAIRTYTLNSIGKHRGEGFDLCDQTHCQVMREASPVTEQAALATSGQVLLYQGALATVYYSASCGGQTERPSNVWPGAVDFPYLPSRHDDGCGGMPQWSTELTTGDLQRALRAAGFQGTLRNVRVGSRNESGRAADLILDGLTPPRISGQDLRAAVGRTIGWQYVRSTAFELDRTNRGFRFRGQGYGHGVGMCVIGSTKLASAGETAAMILSRYYPGTEIVRHGPRMTAVPPEIPRIAPPPPPRMAAAPAPIPSADLPVSLSEGDEGEREFIARMVTEETNRLAATLAVPTVTPPSVRFHPTTEAYEQATGEPWFTLGSVAGAQLHFVPLSILRERGVLERAVRHQIVHLLADSAFAGRSRWVREGAAIHFSEGTNGPGNRGSCPLDAEFERPASVSALGDVYARARACFESQLSTGRSWRDIR
jgi:SpoIID/LytB domain protein